MPQIFRTGSYTVYLWSYEGEPAEPIHVHISIGAPHSNATKVWITKSGKTLVESNRSRIPAHDLNTLLQMIETRSFEIISMWKERFGTATFYC